VEEGLTFINFAPTGMLPTKADTPHVPVTVEEIATDLEKVASCVAIAHLHARHADGSPTWKRAVYKEMVSVAKDLGLITCVSTSGRSWQDFDKRVECLDAEPDMASLTLSSLNFPKQAVVNSPDVVKRLAQEMLDRRIKPELEVFDLGMIQYARYLIDKGLLSPPYYFNLILGNVAGAQVEHLATMAAALPRPCVWSVGGIGDAQVAAMLAGLSLGSGVRIGLEDNIWWSPRRERLATNEGLVRRVESIAAGCDVELATPEKVKEWLEI